MWSCLLEIRRHSAFVCILIYFLSVATALGRCVSVEIFKSLSPWDSPTLSFTSNPLSVIVVMLHNMYAIVKWPSF